MDEGAGPDGYKKSPREGPGGYEKSPQAGQIRKQVRTMEKILNAYYANNAWKLRSVVDKILMKFGGLSDKDTDDFYSLANEVFWDVLKRYDGQQSFDAFLYSCLSNRIKSEITRRNRSKRKTDELSIPIDTPVGGDESLTIGDVIPSEYQLENEAFAEKEEGYSSKMLLYLNRLSGLQKEVLKLAGDGYLPNEIKEKLHISEGQYSDCYAAIRSYRNVSVLI